MNRLLEILRCPWLDSTSHQRQSTINKCFAVVLLLLVARGTLMNGIWLQQSNEYGKSLEEWRKANQVQEQSIIQTTFPEMSAPAMYAAAIAALVAAMAIMSRVIIVQYRDGRDKDRLLREKSDEVTELVRDSITNYKEMTATFNALKPSIKQS